MTIILSMLFGAAGGAGGLWYWQRKQASKGPDAKTQGGGGPGEEQTPP